MQRRADIIWFVGEVVRSRREKKKDQQANTSATVISWVYRGQILGCGEFDEGHDTGGKLTSG